MTAVSLFALNDCALLLADTAQYHADGRIYGFGSKVASCPRLRLAIAYNGLGTSTTIPDLTAELNRHETQSQALAALPALVSFLDAEGEGLIAAGSTLGFTECIVQLFIAAWDVAARRPAAFIIGSRAGTFGPGYEPLTLRRVSRVVSPPVAPEFYPDRPGFALDSGALELIDAQRRAPGEGGLHLVGGEAELTSVGPAGITRRTLLRWPDRVGELVAA